jgi:acyl-CoA-binding protein
MTLRSILLIAAMTSMAAVADAQTDTDTTSRRYTLFKPVPESEMGDMETDRPDVTESAYSVPAGHFQVETDLVRHVRNTSSGERNINNTYNLANYKLGLSNKMDIQFVVPTYVTVTTRNLATRQITGKASGFDDISVRLKYNFWGNSGGKSALAMLPYVTLPTSSISNNGVQGGIIFPFALELANDWKFGSQAAFSLVKEDDDRYHTEYLYSFTFGHPLVGHLDGFVESFITYSTYDKQAQVFANGGLVFAITGNFNIDAGINYGLKSSADKIYFVGLSFRH